MTRRKRRHQSHDSYDEYENELQDEYDDEYDSDDVDDDSDYDSDADDDDGAAGSGKRRKFSQMLGQTALRREVKLGLAALLVFIGVGGLVTAYFMQAPAEGDLLAEAEVAAEDLSADAEGNAEPEADSATSSAPATPAAYESTAPAAQSSSTSQPPADPSAAGTNDRYGLRSGQRYPDVTSSAAGERYGATPADAPTSNRDSGGRYGDRVSTAAGNPPEAAAPTPTAPAAAPRTAPVAEPSAPQSVSPTAPTRSAEPSADMPPPRYNFERSPRADLPPAGSSAPTSQSTPPPATTPPVERPSPPPTVLPSEQRPAATTPSPAAQPRETRPARVMPEPSATRPSQTPAAQGDDRPFRRYEDARIRVPSESEAPQTRPAAPQRPVANAVESGQAPAGTSSSPNGELPTRQVQQGDNYWHIATQQYGQGEYFKALYEHNRRRYNRSSLLRVGDVVEIPPVDYLIRMYPELCPRQTIGSGASSGVATSGGDRTYVVQAGETLYDIARRELGEAARWQEIYQLNRSQLNADFENPTAGTSLRLPGR